MSDQLHTPAILRPPARKETWYPLTLNRRLAGPQSKSGHFCLRQEYNPKSSSL